MDLLPAARHHYFWGRTRGGVDGINWILFDSNEIVEINRLSVGFLSNLSLSLSLSCGSFSYVSLLIEGTFLKTMVITVDLSFALLSLCSFMTAFKSMEEITSPETRTKSFRMSYSQISRMASPSLIQVRDCMHLTEKSMLRPGLHLELLLFIFFI